MAVKDIVWCADQAALSRRAADHVGAVLAARPDAALALPTGRTPLGLYRELVERVRNGQLDLQHARCFNLDEFAGFDAGHELSYARFLQVHLFDPARVPPGHVRLLRGDAADLDAESAAYEAAIEAAGGLELAVLGLGQNGHIAFNEPGSGWASRTGVVALTRSTRAAQGVPAKDLYRIPSFGISVGIATLRAARSVLLLVAGEKSAALAAWRRGVADLQWPVTSLLDHPDVTVLCLDALQAATP